MVGLRHVRVEHGGEGGGQDVHSLGSPTGRGRRAAGGRGGRFLPNRKVPAREGRGATGGAFATGEEMDADGAQWRSGSGLGWRMSWASRSRKKSSRRSVSASSMWRAMIR